MDKEEALTKAKKVYMDAIYHIEQCDFAEDERNVVVPAIAQALLSTAQAARAEARSEALKGVADKPVLVGDIHECLRRLNGFRGIYIPEYTHGGLRIDALIVDTKTRWARGFEVKVSRGDFLKDQKWKLYTQFCSSLSIACPKGLIQPEEIGDPFGLLWVGRDRWGNLELSWPKKPKRFQTREGMAWLWTYVHIIEHELPRLEGENDRLRGRVAFLESCSRKDGPHA